MSKSPACSWRDCVHPCPCGFYGDNQKPCTCVQALVTKYQKRISGPLLDRIDIHIEVPRVDYEKLSGDRMGESSEAIRQRVQAAWDIQNKRFSDNGSSDIVCNADMRVGEVRQFCKLQDEGQSLMRAAMTQLNLSVRAYHRIPWTALCWRIPTPWTVRPGQAAGRHGQRQYPSRRG